VRRVYFDDPAAPAAAAVVPSAFVAVRAAHGALLMVQRCDSAVWELPGGRVDVGESVVEAAIRETAAEAGLAVRITGLVGLYSNPRQIVTDGDGRACQQFAVVFHGVPVDDTAPRPDGVETCAAAWVSPDEAVGLASEPATRIRIADALTAADRPHLG
jgi:8-oxo-dGTP pyrophosphatase MutT (NUDIX family)